jgi:hypothetical protein
MTRRTALAAMTAMAAGAAVAALAAAGCSSSSAPAPAWHVVLHDLTPTLLSAWGTSPTDVFAVGGPRGNGTPSAVLHYDGSAWTDLHVGGTDTFWWVAGTSHDDVWMVGENGRIEHFDGSGFRSYTSGTTATLYGVWPAAQNDVWAVGGTPTQGSAAPNDVVLHYDGDAWVPSPLPQTLGRAFFKVWGVRTTDDDGPHTQIWIVGEYGTIWHQAAGTWTLEADSPPLATGNLTTVNGSGLTEVLAVGGQDVLEWDGTSWSREDVQVENVVNGVSFGAPGMAAIVGSAGVKQRLAGGAWTTDFASEPHEDLHGVWADGQGGYWAAGGDFVSDPVQGAGRAGTIAYYGTASVGTTLVP